MQMVSVKKLGLLALGLLIGASSMSAQVLGPLSYRAEVGTTFSKISALGLGMNGDKGKQFVSFRLGGSVVMPFEGTALSFNPGLYLLGRGEKQGSLLATQKDPYEISSYALQLPLEVSLMLAEFDEKQHLYINAAPYVAYGLSAKLSGHSESINLYKEKIFRRMDVGAGVSLLYKYRKAFLRVGFDTSLMGQVKGAHEALFNVGTSRFFTTNISVGYQF